MVRKFHIRSGMPQCYMCSTVPPACCANTDLPTFVLPASASNICHTLSMTVISARNSWRIIHTSSRPRLGIHDGCHHSGCIKAALQARSSHFNCPLYTPCPRPGQSSVNERQQQRCSGRHACNGKVAKQVCRTQDINI